MTVHRVALFSDGHDNYDDGVGNRRGDCGCYCATDEARAHGAASHTFTDAALSHVDAVLVHRAAYDAPAVAAVMRAAGLPDALADALTSRGGAQ